MKKTILAVFIAMLVGFGGGAASIWGVNHYRTHIAQASTEKEKTDEALTEYSLWLMAFTGILAVATIGLGAATVGLYLTGEKQVQITREALIGDQRAWIVTSLEIGTEGLVRRNGRFELDVKLRVSNIGRSPAHGVHTNMKLFEDVDDHEIRALAESNKTRHPHSLFVTPNDFYYRHWRPSLEQRDKYNQGAGRTFSPLLVGCVSYDILQDKDVHQIAFVYLIGHKDGSPWGSAFSLTGPDIDPADIQISPWNGGFLT